MLSTPPKKTTLRDNHDGTKAVLKNLFSQPDKSEEHRNPNEQDDKKTMDTSIVKNGDKAVNGIDKPSTASVPPLNFGTAELKKVCVYWDFYSVTKIPIKLAINLQ